jgi:hypothetical protein
MKTQFEQMMDGLNDVEAFLAGKQEGFKAHVPREVDVNGWAGPNCTVLTIILAKQSERTVRR